ncbi:MAG TPA: phage major tail protein, TP901-1 family [Novosphingobium sp.]|nr:phage major tail protein, TP901-1 family [Novosphingobium sp.]
MPAQSGAAFLLKISDGASPPVFNTVAGLRTTQMTIAGQAVTITTKDSAGWRDLLSGAGARSVSVSAAGVFMGSAAESRVMALALSGTLCACQLSFEDGSKVQGNFLVQKLEYSGDYNNERSYTLTLESSGAVVPA